MQPVWRSKGWESLFEQFLRDTKDEAYEPKDRVVRRHKQIDGVHYVVAMRPSEKYYGRFDLLSISIMNNLCYQDYLAQVQRLEASKSEKANT